MFDLRSLRYFVCAYEEGSITGAAERCHISQPSISSAILALEEVLSVPLFVRSKSGVVPTPHGDRLYQRALFILNEADAVVRQFKAVKRREFSLYIQDDILISRALMSRAAPIIGEINRSIPQVVLKLCAANEPHDVRIISEHFRQEHEYWSMLWEEPYVAVVPRSHLLAHKPALQFSDLHNAAFIERPFCPFHLEFTRFMHDRQISLDVRAVAARDDVAIHLAELGLGMTIVPDPGPCAGSGVVVLPFKESLLFPRRIGLACDRTDQQNVELIEAITAKIAKTIR